MHYLLDGNNILKSTPEFLQLANGNFISAQQELVLRAAKSLCGKNRGNFVFVFFDGTGLNYRFGPPPNTKVIFGKDRSADSLIIEKLKRAHDLYVQGKNPGQTVVVSDDREIREAARIFNAISWRTAEFTARLFPPAKNKIRSQFRTTEKIISSAHQDKITDELKKYYKNS
jgi:hypothetical protein